MILTCTKDTPTIQHSLTDAPCAIVELQNIIATSSLSSYKFISDVHKGCYSFDLYCQELQLAIEIDGYINDPCGTPNGDQPKKLFVASLGISVLRFTDYQILTDHDEILRIIKHCIYKQTLLSAS